ncbi:MAG: hypothetical protein GEEBNDBF_02684 [bacterium]|nr:hypothetical protein [bacterium]
MRAIRAVVRQIVERWQPERVILFGSYAYGTPTPDSDVDLLVIMPVEGSMARQAVEIMAELDREFPMDLLVRTPEWIDLRASMSDLITAHWLSHGQVMYEAANQ